MTHTNDTNTGTDIDTDGFVSPACASRRQGKTVRFALMVVAAMALCVGALVASPTTAGAATGPAFVTVCFTNVYGYPFNAGQGATVRVQYQQANGQFQAFGPVETPNASGCTSWYLTGGYVYRFFANNFDLGASFIAGSRSSGFSAAYVVWPGGNYHYGTWYVK